MGGKKPLQATTGGDNKQQGSHTSTGAQFDGDMMVCNWTDILSVSVFDLGVTLSILKNKKYAFQKISNVHRNRKLSLNTKESAELL